MQRPTILAGLLLAGALAPSPNERQARATQGVLEGTVFDSLEMRFLAGAVVELARPGDVPASDTTRPDGRFQFSGIPAGRYLVSFSHPTLDSLGFEAGARVVSLAEQDTSRIRLAIPSARSIARLLCPSDAKTTTSTLLGFVRSAADGAPIGGSTVWVRFDDYLVSRSRIQRDSMERVLQTQGNGYYVAFGLPADVTVLARAASGPDTSGYIELELPPSVFVKRDPLHREHVSSGSSHRQRGCRYWSNCSGFAWQRRVVRDCALFQWPSGARGAGIALGNGARGASG